MLTFSYPVFSLWSIASFITRTLVSCHGTKAEATEHRLRTACAQRGGAAQRSRNCVLATEKNMSETYCLKQKSPLEIPRLGALALALAQAPAPPPAKQNRMVRREGMSRLKPKKHGDSKWDLIGDHRSLIGYTYLVLSIYAPYIYTYL